MERMSQALLLAPSAAARHLLFIKDYAQTAPSPPYAPPPPPALNTNHGIVPAQRVALFAGTSASIQTITIVLTGTTRYAHCCVVC